MSTTLALNYVFATTAGQEFDYSILGEVPGPISADYVVNLEVPKATMDTLLAYSSNWAPPPQGSTAAAGTYTQPEPAVALRLQSVVGPWLDDLTAGLTGATAGGTYYASGMTINNQLSVPTLESEFNQIGAFTYNSADVANGGSSGAASDYLSQIPVEAIQSFTSTVVNTLPLSGVCGDLVSLPNPGSTGVTGALGAVQSLFEQAVAAGMVTAGSTNSAGAIPGASAATAYGAVWTAGQSLAIYVRFDMTKTRKYQLAALADLVAGSTTTGAVSIVFGGETFDCVLGDAAEISNVLPVTYQINLMTVA